MVGKIFYFDREEGHVVVFQVTSREASHNSIFQNFSFLYEGVKLWNDPQLHQGPHQDFKEERRVTGAFWDSQNHFNSSLVHVEGLHSFENSPLDLTFWVTPRRNMEVSTGPTHTYNFQWLRGLSWTLGMWYLPLVLKLFQQLFVLRHMVSPFLFGVSTFGHHIKSVLKRHVEVSAGFYLYWRLFQRPRKLSWAQDMWRASACLKSHL